jgi:hypothetical protein
MVPMYQQGEGRFLQPLIVCSGGLPASTPLFPAGPGAPLVMNNLLGRAGVGASGDPTCVRGGGVRSWKSAPSTSTSSKASLVSFCTFSPNTNPSPNTTTTPVKRESRGRRSPRMMSPRTHPMTFSAADPLEIKDSSIHQEDHQHLRIKFFNNPRKQRSRWFPPQTPLFTEPTK